MIEVYMYKILSSKYDSRVNLHQEKPQDRDHRLKLLIRDVTII